MLRLSLGGRSSASSWSVGPDGGLLVVLGGVRGSACSRLAVPAVIVDLLVVARGRGVGAFRFGGTRRRRRQLAIVFLCCFLFFFFLFLFLFFCFFLLFVESKGDDLMPDSHRIGKSVPPRPVGPGEDPNK